MKQQILQKLVELQDELIINLQPYYIITDEGTFREKEEWFITLKEQIEELKTQVKIRL